MKTRILATVGELGLGLLVGFVTYQVSGERDAATGIMSVVVGLLTSLLAGTLSQHFYEETQGRRLADRLDALIERVSDRMLSAADAASALKYGGVEIPRAQVTRVWLDRLWRTSQRYWGVIYTAPGEVVDTRIFHLGLAILSAKVRVDQVDVRRIFVVDSQQELQHVLPAMRLQQERELNVRWVLRSALESHPLLQAQLGSLPSLDFVVIDRSVVWLLLLDGDRRIRSGSLHFDDALNERFGEVFRLMWDAGSPLPAMPAGGEPPPE
jgi:uncharacterized membrane protein YeaQ/YmgE (transglycosylase-associated protein family)